MYDCTNLHGAFGTFMCINEPRHGKRNLRSDADKESSEQGIRCLLQNHWIPVLISRVERKTGVSQMVVFPQT